MRQPIEFKGKRKTTTITSPHFRPNTETEIKDVVFSMIKVGSLSAALGDMIAWMPAILFIAREYNYVAGHLIVPPFFFDVARNIMSEFPHWRVYTKIPDRLSQGTMLKAPMDHPINATGMHLVDLGFLYFAAIVPPPEEHRFYPVLDLEDVELPDDLGNIGAFAVMTPGATTSTRAMLPSDFNRIVDHLLSKEITPVFLGSEKMISREIEFDKRYDLSKGVNLINKTSLLEAAKVIEAAKVTLGIDNGLLHLAGCTDAAMIYGLTMTGPTQRRIPRRHGHTVELYADKEKLPCLFCQERVRFFVDHQFTNCIYKENEPACVKALNAETWCAAIDQILEESNAEVR